MAGPNEGKTSTRLYGVGFSATKEDTFHKWGIFNSTKIDKSQVNDYIYYDFEFAQKAVLEGCEILKAYRKEAYMYEKKDFEVGEGDKLRTYLA